MSPITSTVTATERAIRAGLTTGDHRRPNRYTIDLAGILGADPHNDAADLADRGAATLALAEAQGIRFVVPGDDEFPLHALGRLMYVDGMDGLGGIPFGLWVKGPARLDAVVAARPVAVVGSRTASTYGEGIARDLGATLAAAGRPVVSGAAFGIDQAAHRGALAAAAAPTVAVLACGVDRAYPAAHRDLLDRIAATGAVVSEWAPGCAPMRSRFLARNRIIATLSSGLVVPEAAVRSGSLNAATWAREARVPVMAYPGPVTSAASSGSNGLIRCGDAKLVTSAADVIESIDLAPTSASGR